MIDTDLRLLCWQALLSLSTICNLASWIGYVGVVLMRLSQIVFALGFAERM